MNKNSTPIIITGSHRSGTTWVGNVLRKVELIYYIHEPLAPNSILRKYYSPNYWYKYLSPNQTYNKEYILINNLFKAKYPLNSVFHFKRKLPITDYRNPNNSQLNKFDYKYLNWRIIAYLDSLKANLFHNNKLPLIPLVKDSSALTSLEWYYKHWKTRNIILIRHPAAFVSSLKRLNWRFDFDNLLNQPDLVNRFFLDYKSIMNKRSNDFISEASLVWLCLTKIIIEYKKLYPYWLYIRHEDLSYDPMKQFELLFKKLDLVLTSKVKKFIQETSDHSNPSDVLNKGKVHQLERNSRENINNWKKRLTNKEIKKIHDITEHISSKFYSDKDW